LAIGKLRPVFRRYAIVDDSDRRHAIELLEARRVETAAQAKALAEPIHGIAVPERSQGVN